MPEVDIREGVRCIGSAMRAQLALLGSLSGSRQPRAGAEEPPQAPGARAPSQQAQDPQLADVVELPRRGEPPAARQRRDR
jgi:hypothetical protein